ncbi:vWA domain-containing protein [Puniceicoccus vermicola]|uniref:VWA domain-containing protein n=1 Tax=Puniceicoccus vermicola TaxID=388746 RepID=A0A7X1B2I3_9BACT|nr:hypothetical protein [Puniceicoccus vermicola]MBC2604347.1 hypothetical protein [Puniceicoccus vermicola]
MDTVETFTWEFGGPLAGIPVLLAFSLLCLAFIGSLIVVWWSYRNALRQLSLQRRWTLSTLRLLTLATLFFCLANPTRVDRTYLAENESPKAILLIDHSASMTIADNRGRTRLDDAVRTWRTFANQAIDRFGEIITYHFDSDLRNAPRSELYPEQIPGPDDTQLLKALQSIMDTEKPEAIFVITDGLDTNDSQQDEALNSIFQSTVPISFITGENRIAEEKMLTLREFDSPEEVLRDTAFPVRWVIEARLQRNRSLPITLQVDDQTVMTAELSLASGYNLLPLSATVTSGQPGERVLTLTVGDDRESKTFRRIVSVGSQRSTRVLYYQGTPDWGFRFTKDIFAREPSIELTSVFKPTDEMTVISGQDEVDELPEQSQALAGFDVVLLSQVPSRQLTPARQKALQEYVRQGGGLLLLLSDADQAEALRRSTLESILPVFLEDAEPPPNGGDTLRNQMRQLRQTGGGKAIQLHPFSIVESSRYAYIFGNEDREEQVIPCFFTAAPIFRAKAGADILAQDPSEKDSAGRSGILLAIQRFGTGHTAVLATDSLWRWKLAEPSDSKAPEQFWQQLLHTVAGAGMGSDALHFVRLPVEVPVGEPINLKLNAGPDMDDSLEVVATSPEQEDFILTPLEKDNPDVREISWTPKTPGEWTISASTADTKTRQFITVGPPAVPKPDRAHENVDYHLLRSLASATGGDMLEIGSKPGWMNRTDDGPTILDERRIPLWSIWPLFLLATAFYLFELSLRRYWKLL